jgi:hypothetical protein
VKGLDSAELGTMIAAVGRFADQYDDQLIAEFYASQPEATNQADVEAAAAEAAGEPGPPAD